MAVTSTIEYCTDRDIQDIMPSISEYDLKRRLYNFISLGNNVYISHSVGLITQLFADGKELNAQSQIADADGRFYKTSITADLDAAPDNDASTYNIINYNAGAFTTGAETDIQVGDYIEIDDNTEGNFIEYAFVEAVNIGVNQITVRRAALGSTGSISSSWTTGNSATIEDYLRVTKENQWYSDTYYDQVILYSATDVNDLIIEAGDDWSTIKTRFRRKASRLIESHLDNRLSREVLKDREGNYPEIIVHITALQTVILLLKAHDPTSEVIESFKDELNELIDGLKEGSIVLPTSTSGDSSKGVIREVSVNTASDLRPVELRGHYHGSGYELIKVIVDSADYTKIGTATFSVYGKNSTTLKTDQIVTSETINGDFQQILGSLFIRWGTDDTATGAVYSDDEYEIELWGSSLDATVSAVGSIVMTRR